MAATEKTDNFWSPQNELATNKILLQVAFVTKSVSKDGCALRSELFLKLVTTWSLGGTEMDTGILKSDNY